jgi:hypothetical protein
VGGWQLAVGSWQWAVGSGQWANTNKKGSVEMVNRTFFMKRRAVVGVINTGVRKK